MKKLLSLLLSLLILSGLSACSLFDLKSPKDYTYHDEDAKLSVHFIDVDQGDSVLMESENEFVLIDAGEREYGDRVADFAEAMGAKQLKYVIATHPHSDHIGGMKTVLERFKTENFITVETDQTTNTWLNVLKTVDRKNITYIDAKAGDSYTFGEASLTIMAPLGDHYSGYNNYSVVTKVMCDDISFLLTGDAEKESEKEMLRCFDDEQLQSDVLKCGHHGSSSSTTKSFLNAVDPAFAVVSCGKGNDYGHPHRETLKKLKEKGIPLYRTDELGTVSVFTDGKGLKFVTQKGENTGETFIPTEGNRQQTEASYVGNKNSKRFHRPSCDALDGMKPENQVTFSSREEALEKGYSPCKSCSP